MTEYTIEIHSPPGALTDDDQLGVVGDALDAMPSILGPVVAANLETGIIDARFQVEASDIASAVKLAADAFDLALEEAGANVTVGGVSAEPVAA